MDPKIIEALKAEHDDVYLLTVDDPLFEGEVIEFAARPPSPAEWQKFFDLCGDDKKTLSAARGLLKSCLLAPTYDEKHADLFTRHPALAGELAKKVAKLAGANVEIIVKKA